MSFAAQRTNEVMRVLTLFSVFYALNVYSRDIWDEL